MTMSLLNQDMVGYSHFKHCSTHTASNFKSVMFLSNVPIICVKTIFILVFCAFDPLILALSFVKVGKSSYCFQLLQLPRAKWGIKSAQHRHSMYWFLLKQSSQHTRHLSMPRDFNEECTIHHLTTYTKINQSQMGDSIS